MAEVVIAGVRIHYEIAGQGHPLVLATGQGTGPEARAELLAGLARDHAVLSYDQRGTGRSERVAQGQPIETLAEDIVGIMDAAGIARAHVIGHSTGTGMATVLAARHPARVTRLVLAAPWTHGDPFLQTIQAMRMAAARTLPPDHYAQLNAAIIYPPDHRRAHHRRFAEMAAKALDAPQDAAGIAARLTAILAFDARPLYPRIACPTLVMAARDDQIMPGWFAEEAARAVPGAQLQILEGGGHMFPETRTAEFLHRVGAFLR